MIIQTGLRTDIPAFYSTWLVNRLKAGFVCVRNPYNPTAVTRYRLSPEVVDVIGFCTKNPGPMLPHLPLLESYGQYWYVTITPYGPDVEPHVPPKEQVMADFRRLSEALGADAVGWRYDPILLSDTYPLERHLANFDRMARMLRGFTHTCVISFIDLYAKVRRNFPEAREVRREDRIRLGSAFADIARENGMTLKTCAEGEELAAYGVDCSGCMTIATYEAAIHCRLEVPKGRASRKECACHLSGDIGMYDTCGHLCRYCYANASPEAVRRNQLLHDPESPFLIGGSLPGDRVIEARQESWKVGQLSFL